jgi:hypothetical protein
MSCSRVDITNYRFVGQDDLQSLVLMISILSGPSVEDKQESHVYSRLSNYNVHLYPFDQPNAANPMPSNAIPLSQKSQKEKKKKTVNNRNNTPLNKGK